MDARIGPLTLQQTAYQVGQGGMGMGTCVPV